MVKRVWKRRRDWWDEGINFTCLPNCGKCCDEPEGIVYLSKVDAERLATFHHMDVEEWLESDCRKTIDGRYVLNSKKESGICIYLKGDKSCSVYSAKPSQCSAFPWWAENLRSERTWRKIEKMCPGLTSEDAILVEGETIRLWVEADLEATIGFRKW